ncbi:MAG: DUF547 domain-containing protein [Flavobacteriales bacterium]|nr:DUF547 domain-containing protein [Flavobacteriales bacterium]
MVRRLFFIVLLISWFGLISQDIRIHKEWNELLHTYVSKEGKVNYTGLVKEKIKLENYLSKLSLQYPTERWDQNDIMAYWINSYNAYTVNLIVDHYPLKSIKEITDAWSRKIIKVGTKNYSLDDVENLILRQVYADNRIHFALNCASNSCSKLRNEAYTGPKLEAQLEEQTKVFINENSQLNISKKELKVSQIFQWYKDDFKSEDSLVKFLNKYLYSPVDTGIVFKYSEYDWSLNEK